MPLIYLLKRLGLIGEFRSELIDFGRLSGVLVGDHSFHVGSVGLDGFLEVIPQVVLGDPRN